MFNLRQWNILSLVRQDVRLDSAVAPVCVPAEDLLEEDLKI